MKKLLENLAALVPFLEPYPIWVKVLISTWILLTAVILISLVFTKARTTVPASSAVPTSQTDAVRPSPIEYARILSGASVETLRQMNGVRGLRSLENDLEVGRLPGGVYGFTVPWILNTDPTGVVGGTGIDRIFLQQTRRGTVVMEVHKTDSGAIYVVGYTSEADLVRLQDPSRRTDADVAIFFEPFREFANAVAIPASRIKRSKQREVEDRYVNDLSVR